jgi:hypothetical protein
MVLNASFNNISAISWWSVLLVEETRVLRENLFDRPAESHCQALSHNVVSSTPRMSGIQTHNFGGDRYGLLQYDHDHDHDHTSNIRRRMNRCLLMCFKQVHR